jgi:hypothetical protein
MRMSMGVRGMLSPVPIQLKMVTRFACSMRMSMGVRWMLSPVPIQLKMVTRFACSMLLFMGVCGGGYFYQSQCSYF